MDFSLPETLIREMDRFQAFLKRALRPHLSAWTRAGEIPREFFKVLGEGGWYGFSAEGGALSRRSALREAMIAEALAAVSPGVAVAALAHMDLGFMSLFLFGSDPLKARYGPSAVLGERILSLGNTENIAGSDVAGIGMPATKVDGGWLLNGAKAFVTNGHIADLAVITAISDPLSDRSRRVSMFLVDLSSPGVTRKKLNKRVWIPSDLTRLRFNDVFVPDDHLLGERGRGLQQVLTVFTHSRLPIGALTLGTAAGAFQLAVIHGSRRKIFGKRIIDFQAKAFEIADFHARIEATRMMIWRACDAADRGGDVRIDASMAKYLSVDIALKVTAWAADLFGAASVIFEHPIHKFRMDAWASSLGEGTQDIQKRVIFEEVMKTFEEVKTAVPGASGAR